MQIIRLFTVFFLLAASIAEIHATQTETAAINIPQIVEKPKLAPNLEDLGRITTEAFPDADYVLFDNIMTVRYAEDGKAITYDDSIFKVLTEKGRRQFTTQSFRYNAFYEEMKITQAQIIAPDGSIRTIDVQKNSKEMTDRSSMSANIYDPNDKIITLAVPNLRIGDSLQVIFEKRIKRARMENTFSDWQMFENPIPILNTRYEVYAPKTKPLKSIAVLDPVKNTISYTKHETDDETVHVWEVKNVPQAFPEPQMPDFSTCTQRLLISTLENWEEVSEWYWNICEPHLAASDEILAKVKTISDATANEDEKLRAIFKFVSQEIRYMGITLEKDSPGYEPHDVSITFNNRYGVCRDKAALLVTMLRAAGFDAYPVLIMVGDPRDPEVPIPYFNHAVTAVRNADGSYQLMDSTDENTADLFPAYLYNRSYIVANPKGETLQRSPVASPEDNLLTATTEIKLDSDGKANVKIRLDFKGINDNAYRGHFARSKPEDIRRMFEGGVKDLMSGATLEKLDISPKNMLDTNSPLKVEFSFSAPDFFEVKENKTLILSRFYGSGFSILAQIIGEGTGLEKRRFPLQIPITCGVDENLEIMLPPNFGKTLALPDDLNIDTTAVLFEKSFSREDQKILGKLKVRLRAPQVEPEEYSELKNTLKEMEYASRQIAIFEASPETPLRADVHLFENNIELKIKDAHSGTITERVRKQVLTYDGKKSNSELYIDYNTEFEKVKITAQVTQKDGSIKTLIPEELNELDASWVSSAPRYPVGKTLVVSFPGVEEGSIIEYSLEREFRDSTFISITTDTFGFAPVDKETYTVAYPKDLPLYIENQTDGTITENDTENIFSVETSRPLSESETNIPPAHYLGCSFRASAFNHPKQYADLLHEAIMPLCITDGSIKEKADELTQACSNDKEKIIAIRDYLAKYIRRAGPYFGNLPLDCLSSPETTLSDGYGHQADRSILLYSLLKAAGLEPELLLTSTGATTKYFWQEGEPLTSGIFTEIIVRVKPDESEAPYYLDQLNIYSELGTTGLEGAQAIVLGGDTLETIQVSPEYQGKGRSRYHLKIKENGNATLTFSTDSVGPAFAEFKRSYTEITPEDLRRFQEQLVSSFSQEAKIIGSLKTEYKTYPGLMEITVEIPRFGVRSDEYLYFDIPGMFTGAFNGLPQKRKLPLFLSNIIRTEADVEIELPENASVELLPENIDWEGPKDFGFVTVTCEKHFEDGKNPRILIQQQIQLQPAIISSANYPSLLEINKHLSNKSQSRILLKLSEVQIEEKQ